jgi:hypothetical protein
MPGTHGRLRYTPLTAFNSSWRGWRLDGLRCPSGYYVGWVSEGAIGSEYKVDAAYLSPNVNMQRAVASAAH